MNPYPPNCLVGGVYLTPPYLKGRGWKMVKVSNRSSRRVNALKLIMHVIGVMGGKKLPGLFGLVFKKSRWSIPKAANKSASY